VLSPPGGSTDARGAAIHDAPANRSRRVPEKPLHTADKGKETTVMSEPANLGRPRHSCLANLVVTQR